MHVNLRIRHAWPHGWALSACCLPLWHRLGPRIQRVFVQTEKLLNEKADLVRVGPIDIKIDGFAPEDAKYAGFDDYLQHQLKSAIGNWPVTFSACATSSRQFCASQAAWASGTSLTVRSVRRPSAETKQQVVSNFMGAPHAPSQHSNP